MAETVKVRLDVRGRPAVTESSLRQEVELVEEIKRRRRRLMDARDDENLGAKSTHQAPSAWTNVCLCSNRHCSSGPPP